MIRNPFRRRWALAIDWPGGPPIEIRAFWLRSSAVLAVHDHPQTTARHPGLLAVVRRG